MELGMLIKKNYSDFAKKALVTFASGKSENVVFSPFSVVMLLAILADATKGEARKEILAVIDEGVYKDFADILAKIQRPFILANAVFVKKSLEKLINPEFLEKLAKYEGELFATENYVADINEWVYEKTENIIEKILEEPYKPLSDASFINTACFFADWEYFCDDENVKECKFRNADQSFSIVNMMKCSENYYVEDDFYRGFVKPYYDEKFSFLALLPKKSGADSFDDALEHLDFVELFSQRKRAKVSVSMPEFECCWKGDLKKFCINLGVKTLFSQKADFSPFSKDEIGITDMVQKATIEVNRLGAKTAAVTYCKKKLMSPLPIKSVSLDRPFVYAIVHDDTMLPVFVGAVKSIETIRALEINFETVFDYGITDKEVRKLFKYTKCKTVEELKEFQKSRYTNTLTGDFYSYLDLSKLFEFRGLTDKAKEYDEKADQTEFWQYEKDHPRRT